MEEYSLSDDLMQIKGKNGVVWGSVEQIREGILLLFGPSLPQGRPAKEKKGEEEKQEVGKRKEVGGTKPCPHPATAVL